MCSHRWLRSSPSATQLVRRPAVLNDWQLGPPRTTSTSPLAISAISAGVNAVIEAHSTLVFGWFKRYVAQESSSLSSAKTILYPAARKPSESPPAPQYRSIARRGRPGLLDMACTVRGQYDLVESTGRCGSRQSQPVLMKLPRTAVEPLPGDRTVGVENVDAVGESAIIYRGADI